MSRTTGRTTRMLTAALQAVADPDTRGIVVAASGSHRELLGKMLRELAPDPVVLRRLTIVTVASINDWTARGPILGMSYPIFIDHFAATTRREELEQELASVRTLEHKWD